MKNSISISIVFALLTFIGSAVTVSAATVVGTSSDATYFEISPTDIRVNNDVNRIGGNNGGTTEFISFIAFDITGLATEIADATAIDLSFTLGAQDNSPALDNLTVEYIGTWTDNTYGINGVNGANANVKNMASALGTEIYNSTPGLGAETISALTAVQADTTNQYAVFRFSDSSVAAHQWDIPDLSATLTIVPEPSTYALLVGFISLCAVMSRRRA